MTNQPPLIATVATPEACEREAYTTHQLAALALEASLYPAAYPCATCHSWHLGERGPLQRCRHCDRVVWWRSRNGVKVPSDPDTGRDHSKTCEARATDRAMTLAGGPKVQGICSVCHVDFPKCRTTLTGDLYCSWCWKAARTTPNERTYA